MLYRCLLIDGNKQFEALSAGLNHQLASLAAQITDAERKVSDTFDNPMQNGSSLVIDTLETKQHVQHIEEYIQSAKTVYSNASVYAGSTSGAIVGDSFDMANMSETFGSVLGLSDDQRNRVNQWLPGKDANQGNMT